MKIITQDEELAKDVTQEAFLKAYKNISNLKNKNKFGQWVFTIALNVKNDMLREKINNRNNTISLFDKDGKMQDYIIELTDFNTPEKSYEYIETIQELRKYIKELSIEEREIIILRYLDKLTYEQISEQTNVKESTLRVKALRAKAKILNKLKGYLGVKEHNSND
ncbi:ECF RNA polymerase sigma factor SigW [Oxobacter pfennigii]|uniref:ECF RNA polymerase sigma factor SigW n=2 Tax=Oxobacter pfennigii TaxID=36849 RepID=A0A0P8WF06_9CLOT|nr:ECF RNA polymerase sigma factor SigW [Oxobacter pfennigii]